MIFRNSGAYDNIKKRSLKISGKLREVLGLRKYIDKYNKSSYNNKAHNKY